MEPDNGLRARIIPRADCADNSGMSVLYPAAIAEPVCAAPEPAGGLVDLSFEDRARPEWVQPGMRLRVPYPKNEPMRPLEGNVLVWGTFSGGSQIPIVSIRSGPCSLELAFPWSSWLQYVLEERYTYRRRPMYTRFPVSYQRVPPGIRHRLAQHIYPGRRNRSEAFPSGLFEPGFEALLHVRRRWEQDDCSPDVSPRVCLTHDIDTAEGFRHVGELAEVESALGLRSSWNVVVAEYAVDFAVLDWLTERGFEIGLHDYLHDNKLIYLSEPAMRRRLDRCRAFIERYDVRGFRSPSWFRSPTLMRVLADYVAYDGSCLDFDWLCPAGRGGVLTCRPFAFGSLIEIPTTLPLEAAYLEGVAPSDLQEYWRPKVNWLAAIGGCAVVNTHPDPHYSGNSNGVRAYGEFLERLLPAFGGQWSLPSALAEEVRSRA
jgi:peptidoglycan/xylan/chitin deacetylase (PgdA/CDA1 family)